MLNTSSLEPDTVDGIEHASSKLVVSLVLSYNRCSRFLKLFDKIVRSEWEALASAIILLYFGE
ncbi:hypothetical protein THRCLA_20130 [Thraustotheca clavata]|uniref:Uncharacterized protein n=1 Tax=Thraustotheca clavata TaxID=74557 RepID=A0A1W0AB97_9STRA|nr:hypothetical protein THRCLA_20130 [Thraustotheca clavata]